MQLMNQKLYIYAVILLLTKKIVGGWSYYKLWLNKDVKKSVMLNFSVSFQPIF
jgi:hypothetical protein